MAKSLDTAPGLDLAPGKAIIKLGHKAVGNNKKINLSYVLLNSAIYKAGIISGLKCFDTSSPNNHDKSYQAYAQILEVTDDKQSSDKMLHHTGNH